jgi:hypothetical protein
MGFGNQAGFSVTWTPERGTPLPKPISLELPDVPVWEALDRICAAGKVGFDVVDSSTVRVGRQQTGSPPVGYAGPLRLHLAATSYHRSVNLLQATSESMLLHLQLMKEPRAPVLSLYPPRLTRALDGNGRSLLPPTQPLGKLMTFPRGISLSLPALFLKPLDQRAGKISNQQAPAAPGRHSGGNRRPVAGSGGGARRRPRPGKNLPRRGWTSVDRGVGSNGRRGAAAANPGPRPGGLEL